MKRARPAGADEAQPRPSPEFEDYTATAAAYDAARDPAKRKAAAQAAVGGAASAASAAVSQASALMGFGKKPS